MAKGVRHQSAAVTAVPEESAQAAGLRYVRDTSPGIRRTRRGKGFTYTGPDGHVIRDAATLERIRRLAIPPAYTDVWICPNPNGHLQATGRDARGRKQYRYHPRWRAARDETKFGRMLAFSAALPGLRQRLQRDLQRPGLAREKVLATVVRLLESTGIRVGNDEYARANHSFGLTTLRDDHVEIEGATMRFEFHGKSGKTHQCDVTDRRLARIVRACQSIPGEELFQYLDDDGERRTIDSGDVNAYLQEITGQDFTTKDFRTWTGTRLALDALRSAGHQRSERQARTAIVHAVDQVAEELNNTRAVCRKYYIHPAVLDAFLDGGLEETVAGGHGGQPRGLDGTERALVRLLKRHTAAAA